VTALIEVAIGLAVAVYFALNRQGLRSEWLDFPTDETVGDLE
jgi:hypothetical protein